MGRSASRTLEVASHTRDTAQRYISPGEANRNEAAALAWTNEIALGNEQLLTQNLLVRQMGRDLDRFDQKKADDMTSPHATIMA